MSVLPSWTIPSGHLDKRLAPCKGSQNSLGFWIPCCEFQIPGTRFQIAYQWNLDSRLQPLVAFQIELYSGCQSPKSGFHKQKNPGFWILQLNLSWVPDSLTRGKVSNVPNSDLEFCVRFASIKLNEVLHSSNKYQPLDMYQYYVILCTTIHGYFQMHKMWTAKHAQLWPSNYSLEMLSVAIKYCDCPLVPWNYCTSSVVLRRRKLTHHRDPRVETVTFGNPKMSNFTWDATINHGANHRCISTMIIPCFWASNIAWQACQRYLISPH